MSLLKVCTDLVQRWQPWQSASRKHLQAMTTLKEAVTGTRLSQKQLGGRPQRLVWRTLQRESEIIAIQARRHSEREDAAVASPVQDDHIVAVTPALASVHDTINARGGIFFTKEFQECVWRALPSDAVRKQDFVCSTA